MISIVTPVHNASELIPLYDYSTTGAEIVIVDNGSSPFHAALWQKLVERRGGIYVRNEENLLFAIGSNQGLAVATGDIVVCMNNDVECTPGWLSLVESDTPPAALSGPSLLNKYGVDYIEGYCIAARKGTWQALPWNTWDYKGLYWEDNDLCLRALQRGYRLIRTTWPVYHRNNYTSDKLPGARDHAAENEAIFARKVAEWGSNAR